VWGAGKRRRAQKQEELGGNKKRIIRGTRGLGEDRHLLRHRTKNEKGTEKYHRPKPRTSHQKESEKNPKKASQARASGLGVDAKVMKKQQWGETNS